jgi:hypothetical protein
LWRTIGLASTPAGAVEQSGAPPSAELADICGVGGLPDDPEQPVPIELSDEDSQEFERRVVGVLRDEMIGGQGGLVEIEAIELQGSRPDTLVVFRYQYRPQYIRRHPGVVAGPQAEIARFWDFAADPDDQWSRGLMNPPGVVAAAIGSSFDAAWLPLVDPETLVAMGSAPNIFPRRYDLEPPRSNRST